MVYKLQNVSDLAGQAAHAVTHSIDGWKQYLAAPFMEKELGEGDKGVSIGGPDHALWSSKEGFRTALGRSAFGPGSTIGHLGERRRPAELEPMSSERQKGVIEDQSYEIMEAIREAKEEELQLFFGL